MKKNKTKIDADFIGRLNTIASKVGSVNALATKSGVPQSTLRNYWKGGEPGRPHLVALANASGVTVAWLATGEGECLTKNESTDYCQIKLYDIQASAGHGTYIENEKVMDVVSFREKWIRNELNCDPNQLTMIFVTGDSMEPTLHSGDVVLIDHSAINSVTDAIWVIGVEEGPLVKRVQVLPGAKARIISDNKTYESWDVDLKELPDGMRFIGRVVWSGRRM